MANRPEHQRSFESPNTSHRGVSRIVRLQKRLEAEHRNATSVPDRRRQFWRDRGFTNQSHAARAVLDTVSDCNDRAAALKQRSEDWPLVPEEIFLV
jgi:hypothetical protein